MRTTVTFTAETTRNFVTNHRRGPDYKSTIQNQSGESITITVTNDDIQKNTSPTFVAPAAGALVIADGAMGSLNEAYDGWLITAAMSATGTVDIVEAG